MSVTIRHLLRRSLPVTSGSQVVEGLHERVTVIRDRWGVPHIYAGNAEDLFFAQGFAHAQDRLFQMEAYRRVGLGRLGELVGSSALDGDRLARIAGWHRAAEALVSGMLEDEETARVARAYAAGVNAFIASGTLPPEYTLLACRPEPWRPLDSAAWAAVLAWGLSANWEMELLRARLIAALGAERAADLAPGYGDGYPAIVPGPTVGTRAAEALAAAYQEFVRNMPFPVVPGGTGAGSNNWVVSGEHTRSGRPILANDPHLPPLFPPIWYENHLVGGGYNVTGFTSPGFPGVILGHNERIAWGVTNAFPDIQDLYVERFHREDDLLYEVDGQWVRAEERLETIKVRGRREPHVERVRYTRHGPVISSLVPGLGVDLALRWAAHDPHNHMRAVLDICRATDWDSFQEAARHWAFPSQNLVYADVDGNIGYLMPGHVPRRAQGQGLAPAPGWTSDYDWRGWIPAGELPRRYNPREGFIVTANNRVVADDYPYFICGEWLPPYRAMRIAELLQAQRPLDLEAMARIQNDTLSLPMKRFVRLALPLLEKCHELAPELREAAALLEGWNGDMRADSSAATLAFAWFVHFLHAALEQALGSELKDSLLQTNQPEQFAGSPFQEVAHELVLCWLEGGPPGWVRPVESLVQPAFGEAVAALARRFGPLPQRWQWGRLHAVHLRNELARIPVAGRLWRPLKFPAGGDGYTVNQAEVAPNFPPGPVEIIASCRMIIDVGEWDNSISALPGGQSGHPASPHYHDHVDDWRHGRYHPMLFSRGAIDAVAEGELTLLPPGRGRDCKE